MTKLPLNIVDGGYFDLRDYTFIRSLLTGTDLDLTFQKSQNRDEGFVIQLRTVVAFNDFSRDKNISTMRVDSNGSSFGHDIAARLGNNEYMNYCLLYLFEDIDHTSPIFRGLAKTIKIYNFDKQIGI